MAAVILYNGATGSLGQYMAAALQQAGERWHRLDSRVEDRDELASELGRIDANGPVTLVHLAARVSVSACESDPLRAREVNVIGARAVVSEFLDWTARGGARALWSM